jgi:NAD(P)-dependent dehydrogenase (short-subunit alcohol dehydrogenase family)
MNLVAIITGGGSGIGLATAFRFADMHFAVTLVGRHQQTLDDAVRQIEHRGGEAVGIPADVSHSEQFDAVVRQVVAKWGRVDVLVNNAGYAPSAPTVTLSNDQWHAVLNTNLSAAFYGTRAVWAAMKQQELSELTGARGVIVNISSMASKDPFPGLGAYGVAKAGLNMLTLATAREGQEAAIRVVCIAPAAVDTPMFRTFIGDRPVPEGIMLHPDDVAAMIVDAVAGSLRHCSGDTLFIHRRTA